MKKIIIPVLLALLLIPLALPQNVSADIISSFQNPYPTDGRIVNVKDFPDIVLIGYCSYLGIQAKYIAYEIKDNEWLRKIDNYDSYVNVYWIKREDFNHIDLQRLNLKEGSRSYRHNYKRAGYKIPSDLNLLSDKLEISNGYTSGNIMKIEQDYTLVRCGQALSLYKSAQKTFYTDSTPPKVETFPMPDAPYLFKAKIVNLNEFPDLILISQARSKHYYIPYEVKNNTFLSFSMYTEKARIYYMDKVKYEPGAIAIDKIVEFPSHPDATGWWMPAPTGSILLGEILNGSINGDSTSPLIEIDQEYSQAKSSDGYILYRSGQWTVYSDGQPAKYEASNLKGTSTTTSSALAKPSFWDSILVFLKNLFNIK